MSFKSVNDTIRQMHVLILKFVEVVVIEQYLKIYIIKHCSFIGVVDNVILIRTTTKPKLRYLSIYGY